MSFDSTNQSNLFSLLISNLNFTELISIIKPEIGLLELAANHFLIRDQLTNDRLDLSQSNNNKYKQTAQLAAYIIQALCQAQTSYNHVTPSLKDEPFTREKLKITIN